MKIRWQVPSGVLAGALMGVALAPLLIGVEPIGGDPDRLYRPLKAELARSLAEGRLPWWSDRFGHGYPIVAESHAAAFYPPNLVLYRVLDVHRAYSLSMWLHHVLMAAGVFAYGRRLGLTAAGAVLAATIVPLCGFSSIHASHEVFYHALAWLPWALVLGDRVARDGRMSDVAGLVLVLGAQWTVGHFQVQTWTAGLVVMTGVIATRGTGSLIKRTALLGLAVIGGAAVAAAQLGPSWELAGVVGQTARSLGDRMYFIYPREHLLLEPFAPWLLRGMGPMDPYWHVRGTSGYESALYVGTIPLLLAAVGLLAKGVRGRFMWAAITAVSLALATMPGWWPEGYAWFLAIPVVGSYRAPGRFTALASLGLALLAGAGLDRAIDMRRWIVGLTVSAALVVVGVVAVSRWLAAMPARGLPLASFPAGPGLLTALVAGSLAVGFVVVLMWRKDWLPSWLLVVMTAAELGALYYTGPIEWGWSLCPARSSPALAALAREKNVGRVGGGLDNLPTVVGLATASPYVGFRLLEPDLSMRTLVDGIPQDRPARDVRLAARTGVTHWLGRSNGPIRDDDRFEVVYSFVDRSLGPIADGPSVVVVRSREPSRPFARVATGIDVLPGGSALPQILESLITDRPNRAWFRAQDLPRVDGPMAREARVTRWDGRVGEVDHDGPCVLVLDRAWYPGWESRANETGPWRPVLRADGGRQTILIKGRGPSRIETRYRVTRLAWFASISILLAMGALVIALWPRQKPGPLDPEPEPDSDEADSHFAIPVKRPARPEGDRGPH